MRSLVISENILCLKSSFIIMRATEHQQRPDSARQASKINILKSCLFFYDCKLFTPHKFCSCNFFLQQPRRYDNYARCTCSPAFFFSSFPSIPHSHVDACILWCEFSIELLIWSGWKSTTVGDDVKNVYLSFKRLLNRNVYKWDSMTADWPRYPWPPCSIYRKLRSTGISNGSPAAT